MATACRQRIFLEQVTRILILTAQKGIPVLGRRIHTEGEPKLSRELGIKTINSIPCFCDIQFSEKEFLTVLNYPDHPFSYYINQIITEIRTA